MFAFKCLLYHAVPPCVKLTWGIDSRMAGGTEKGRLGAVSGPWAACASNERFRSLLLRELNGEEFPFGGPGPGLSQASLLRGTREASLHLPSSPC